MNVKGIQFLMLIKRKKRLCAEVEKNKIHIFKEESEDLEVFSNELESSGIRESEAFRCGIFTKNKGAFV